MNDTKLTTTYALTGLHCGACVNKVTQALAPLAAGVEVSLKPMQVTLTEPHAGFEALKAAVERVGKYVLISRSEPIQSSNQAPDKSLEGQNIPVNVIDKNSASSWLATYRPLFLILAYILASSFLVQIGMDGMAGVTTADTMRYFMAGFFLVFSFFKLLDIGAFADAYSAYDLLSRRWHGWGKLYPFVELSLGIAYLAHFNPLLTHWTTIVVMGFSAIGVIRSVVSKTQIQCACLGTVFKLPMSTVTIVEDVGMVAMAAVMLVFS